MRLVDLAAAVSYALVCVSVVAVMSPHQSMLAASDATSDRAANAVLMRYVNSVGLPFLAASPAARICSSMYLASNASLVVDGIVDGVQCSPPPTGFVGFSTASFGLPGREVTIEVWLLAA